MINLIEITKNYGKHTILKDFNLEIQKNEMVAVMGKSGSGKTTLLNIIGLIDTFENGKYIFDKNSENIKPNSQLAQKIIRYKISYLFQNYALIEDETVEYNLKIALKYLKLKKGEIKKKISEALNIVGLPGYENNKVFELSGGEQQRVAVARAYLKPCDVLLADEPTGALDDENKKSIMKLIQNLHESGKTIVIVTHDPEIASMCQRTIRLN